MNLSRLALAAVVATLVDGFYGFLVYGQLLGGEFSKYPNVFRSTETQTAYLPLMFVGILVGMFAIAYVFTKGYEGAGVAEGARFGLIVGVFNAGYFLGTDYGILNVDLPLIGLMAIAGLVEWTIVGLVIAAIYQRAGAVRPHAARV